MTGWPAMFRRIRDRMLRRKATVRAPEKPGPLYRPRNTEQPGLGFLRDDVRSSRAWRSYTAGRRRNRW